MQADEFEKKIQDKMEGFELAPNAEVWKQVAARINKEKKKRRALVYWLLCCFVVLSGVSVLLVTNNEINNSNEVVDIKSDLNKVENFKRKSDLNVNKSSHTLKKVQKINGAENIQYRKKSDLKYFAKEEIKNNKSSIDKERAIERESLFKQENKYEKTYKQDNYAQKDLPPHKFYNPSIGTTKGDSATEKIIGRKANINKDSLTLAIVRKNIGKTIKTNKNWTFGLSILGGISDNLNGLPLLSNTNYAQDYTSSPVSSPGNYSSGLSNNFKSASSFGVGMLVQRDLSKKMTLLTGINYHLYQFRSSVGQGINNSAAFYDLSSRSITFLNSYYNTGNSVNYTNKYQLIELPIAVEYQMNNNEDKPFKVSAGISPGYLLGSNALFANPSANVYYLDKRKYHRFQLFGGLGFSFPLINTNGYFISAGPVIQYGITNAIKTSDNSAQHLFFTGLKGNIIFK